MQALDDRQWLARIPKVELHLHLEGAIPLDALWELIASHGGDPSVPDREALENRFVYRDFDHFLSTWEWKNGFVRTYDDFALIAEAVARDLQRQNVVHVEAFFSPGDFAHHGLEPQRIAEAIRTGLSRVDGISVSLVADLVRDFGAESGMRTLEQVAEVQHLGVVGIGIGGSEHRVPPEVFRDVYEHARQLDFHTSAHAGEAAGAESVWGAVRVLEVDRIGHGTRAVEDPELVDLLAERRVPLELCPISNLRTGVITSISEHPARLFFERGIPLSVNTDDPAMFGTSLAHELGSLMCELSFTRDEIRQLTLQAARSSWLPDEKRRELIERIDADPVWNTSPTGRPRSGGLASTAS
jgi:adenosine deaminase